MAEAIPFACEQIRISESSDSNLSHPRSREEIRQICHPEILLFDLCQPIWSLRSAFIFTLGLCTLPPPHFHHHYKGGSGYKCIIGGSFFCFKPGLIKWAAVKLHSPRFVTWMVAYFINSRLASYYISKNSIKLKLRSIKLKLTAMPNKKIVRQRETSKKYTSSGIQNTHRPKGLFKTILHGACAKKRLIFGRNRLKKPKKTFSA